MIKSRDPRRRLRSQHRKIRVYQNLRTAHLERAHHHTPASVLYVRRSYDFDDEAADGLDLIAAGTVRAPLSILVSQPDALEVNEPLARLRLPRTFLSIKAGRLAARLSGRPMVVVSHAIENRNPFSVPTGGPDAERLKRRVRTKVEWWLTRQIALELDRLTFGTPIAQDLYLSVLGNQLRSTATRLCVELPSPCHCLTTAPATERDKQVTFLGAFDERKGVRALLAAWPLVHERDPDLRLRLLGKGPLMHEVLAASKELPAVKVVVDPARDVVHRSLRDTGTLVLLSQPRERWREQVGLPIVEGLAHGCAIVTTEQSGLAPWLAEHGHSVVASSGTPAETACEIVRATRLGRAPADVLDHLPAVDGRTAADRWLFSSEGVS